MASILRHKVASMEHRQAERAKVCRKLKLSLESNGDHPFQEPALSKDLSLLGACVTTRSQLEPGQKVFVRIPTDGCPRQWGLPRELDGVAEVRRVETTSEGTLQVALRFGKALANSMEFGFFMAYLLGRESGMSGSYA